MRITLRLPAGNPLYDGVIETYKGIFTQAQQAEYLRLCVAVGHALLTGGQPGAAEMLRKGLNRGFSLAEIPMPGLQDPGTGSSSQPPTAPAQSSPRVEPVAPLTTPPEAEPQAGNHTPADLPAGNTQKRPRLIGNLTGKGNNP